MIYVPPIKIGFQSVYSYRHRLNTIKKLSEGKAAATSITLLNKL